MTTFVGKGQDIARALDNALLFCDPKAEYLPGIVHVEFAAAGIAFSACDDYATGRDRVGEVTLSTAERFEISEDGAEDMAKFARSARTKAVALEYAGQDLRVTIGDDTFSVSAVNPSAAWDDILPLMDDPIADELLQTSVAFNAARLTKFGRVKTTKNVPIDIRFMGTEGAPIAFVKVGPTFRGQIQGVRRDEALKHMGPEGPDCFW